MRYLMATLVIALASCQPAQQNAAERQTAQAEMIRQAEAKQTLNAFGGTLIGKNEGEWGGEVAFREPGGSTYTVIADNSIGIFQMPYGVVALTGLAHGGINRGAVHMLSRPEGGRVAASLLKQLPGAPCDVERVDDRIHMRIRYWNTANGEDNPTLGYHCYALISATELAQHQCRVPAPESCAP